MNEEQQEILGGQLMPPSEKVLKENGDTTLLYQEHASLRTIKPELLEFSNASINALSPLWIVLLVAALGLVTATFKKLSSKWFTIGVVFLGLLAGAVLSYLRLDEPPLLLFNGMLVWDSLTQFIAVLAYLMAAGTVLASVRYLDRETLQFAEYYLLVLFSAIGMVVMAASGQLITLFIALEVMSLSVYALVAFRRSDRRSNEASLKYFVMGGAASAVMLYGCALLYGATGTLQINQILTHITEQSTPSIGFIAGAWLVVLGFLFKVAAAPFHSWMPDVYEGAPTPVTGFMTTALKASVFVAFLRVFTSLGYAVEPSAILTRHFHDVLWVLAVVTMVFGNVVALTQTQLKRMLAYSSIAHTGYLLLGFISGGMGSYGHAGILVYLVSYAVMNLGAFVVLTAISGKGDTGLALQDLAGLSKRNPALAFALAVFMFSMAGIPPTAGFVGKYLLFYNAVESGEILLVVIAVLTSAVSVYYYLRVLVFAYMKEGAQEKRVPWALGSGAVIFVTVLLTLQIGIFPSKWVEAAKLVFRAL